MNRDEFALISFTNSDSAIEGVYTNKDVYMVWHRIDLDHFMFIIGDYTCNEFVKFFFNVPSELGFDDVQTAKTICIIYNCV